MTEVDLYSCIEPPRIMPSVSIELQTKEVILSSFEDIILQQLKYAHFDTYTNCI